MPRVACALCTITATVSEQALVVLLRMLRSDAAMPLPCEHLLPETLPSRGASQPDDPTAVLDPYILNFLHTLSCPHRYVETSCCGARITAGECRIHSCVHIIPNVGFQVAELCPIILDSHRVSCKCRPTISIFPLDYTSGSDDDEN